MIFASSLFDAPRARSDLTSRSRETVGSPASILATRDWLDCMALANAICVRPLSARRAFRPSASFKRNSMYASSSESWSKSFAEPTRHLFVSRRLRFRSSNFVILYALLTSFDHILWCVLSLLREDFHEHYCAFISSEYHTPCCVRIGHPQFLTPHSHIGHRSGVRHTR